MSLGQERKADIYNTLEKYHIYKIRRKNLYMRDTHIKAHNPIFQRVHESTIASSTHATEKHIQMTTTSPNQYREKKSTQDTNHHVSDTPTGKRKEYIWLHEGSIKDRIILINIYYTLQKRPQYKR
jgi:hypothetical protein